MKGSHCAILGKRAAEDGCWGRMGVNGVQLDDSMVTAWEQGEGSTQSWEKPQGLILWAVVRRLDCNLCTTHQKAEVRRDLSCKLKTHTQVAGSWVGRGARRGSAGRWRRGWEEGKKSKRPLQLWSLEPGGDTGMVGRRS